MFLLFIAIWHKYLAHIIFFIIINITVIIRFSIFTWTFQNLITLSLSIPSSCHLRANHLIFLWMIVHSFLLRYSCSWSSSVLTWSLVMFRAFFFIYRELIIIMIRYFIFQIISQLRFCNFVCVITFCSHWFIWVIFIICFFDWTIRLDNISSSLSSFDCYLRGIWWRRFDTFFIFFLFIGICWLKALSILRLDMLTVLFFNLTIQLRWVFNVLSLSV